MGCLLGLIVVIFILLFKFLFLACGITCIVLGSTYIVMYVQAIVDGLAVPNGNIMLFGSAALVALGIWLIFISFKKMKAEKKSSDTRENN